MDGCPVYRCLRPTNFLAPTLARCVLLTACHPLASHLASLAQVRLLALLCGGSSSVPIPGRRSPVSSCCGAARFLSACSALGQAAVMQIDYTMGIWTSNNLIVQTGASYYKLHILQNSLLFPQWQMLCGPKKTSSLSLRPTATDTSNSTAETFAPWIRTMCSLQ